MLTELDHIVFENRNKEYGAYLIRKNYKRLVIRALTTSVCLVLLIFGSVFLYYYLEDAPHISAGELIAVYEMMEMGIDEELPAPPDLPPFQQSDQTLVPDPELTKPPEVVKAAPTKPIDLKKDLIDFKDSTAKTGDQLTIKTPGGEGVDTGAIYIRVERLPEFPGGPNALNKFLRDNITYPSSALIRKVSGVVHVSFIIDINGKVENVKIAKSVDPAIDMEAIRVVRLMPVWSPGKRHGKPVKVLLTLPIRFMPG